MTTGVADLPVPGVSEWKTPEVSQRDEMWDGVPHMPPAPNTMHQDFEGQLYAFLLYQWAKPRRDRVFQQINLAYPNDPDWVHNYRIPDIVMLSRDRFGIDRRTHFAGAPLVVVEIRSSGDETDEKFPFYAGLGVPEVWVFDRDTK
ncbi:MAG: Uma2 family endonuclease, partial [Fimbriiglobus sp.]